MLLEFLLAVMATATVVVLLVPLLRRGPATTRRLDHDLAIYRDQLGEIERERAAGAIDAEQANAARLEIERRILAAADRDKGRAEPARTPTPPSAVDRMLPVALALVIPLASLGLYLDIGRPGLPSAPFDSSAAARRAAALQEPATAPTPAQVVAEARARVAKNPEDAEAQSALGEALVMEADGTVGEPAVAAFNKALAGRPGDARALFYLGLHEAQSGDSRAALVRWLDLEAKSPEEAPWMATLRGEIARVAKEAGLDPQAIRPDRRPPAPPPAASGMPAPTAEQREAMASMTPEQRQQAIRGMVEGLETRLKDSPQDRAGWLRLANAWRVLGEAARANAAYAKADALGPLETQGLTDWAETLVRQTSPGAPPTPEAVAVLTRLEKAQPSNALALFYLGAASLAAGDKPAAAQRWKTLLALLPADAPIRGMLEAKIKEAE